MDGSYGNVYPTNSPLSPSTRTSTTSQYKTNVNRQKTRKWVEAKPQSYDGDDWGADYDDEPEEPQPPPPPKPMGPRQALGSSLVGRHFQPPGSSPVHTQTQQASAASLGRTGQPASERMSMEHAVSPLSNVPQSAATASSVYSGGPGYGHAAVVSPTSRRMSPAPQGAGPVSTRFPPRKSSMGPYDAPDFVDSARQSVSSSGPGSSHKPWVEARSAPPSSAKSPVSPTSKPLPFIRPSDIYRRMEEEKEKERRSMDSGRPSLDNVFGRGNERVQSPARAQAETGDQKWQAGVGLEEGAECNRSPSVGLGLAPVAERKSEYGIEGLLASYESEEPTIAPASSAQDQTRPPGQSAELRQFTQSLGPEKPLLSQPSVQFDSEEDKSRRFSTSPKLPDLARMSVFGEDLFSRSSKFISDAPPVPAIPNQPEFSRMAQSPTHLAEPSAADKKPALLDNADPPGQLHETSTTHAMSAVSAFPNAESVLEQTTPQNSDDAAESDVLFPRTQDASPAPSPSAEANQRVELPSDRDRSNVTQPAPNASNQQVRVAMTPQQAASATEGKPAFRPSLPGAWVSETVTTPGGLFAPEPSQTLHTTADKAAEAGDVSPMTEGNENTGNSSSGVGKTQLAASDGVSDEVSEASVAKRPMPVSVSSHPASPHSLPPLRTASPALSTSLQMDPISTGTEDNNANNHQPAELTSPIPTTATTTHSEIPFTAPLNPRKDLHEASITPQDFGTLPSILTSSTLDTSSSSPVKESDLLREEIMKSLSPLQSCSEIPEITRPSTAADRQPEHHPRESTYLPDDVYGDYWDSGDDRPDEGVPSPVKGDNEPATTAGVSPSPFDQISKDYGVPGLKSSPHPASDSPSDASPEAHPRPLARFGELRRRFSWESGAEDANAVNAKAQAAGSQVEQKTLGSGLGNLAAATPTVASPEPGTGPSDGASPAMAHLASGPKLDTIPVHNQGETSGMSHQVSQPSTLPSRSTLDATIEPPSPVSTVAERNASPAGNHRLSLAEEKALVHTSVSPISPTPPPEQHPAFAERSHELPQTLGPPATPAKQEVVNIIAFRQIMELPSSAERTKYFNQNRWKYASLEVGLSQWLSALSQHPDHVNATSLFNTALPGPAASTSAQQSTQVQAPYYQQYLNASSSALAQAGRPSGTYMLNMPMPPPQHGASGFGQSGNQVGTKSKELLMAAGKAGKGLLSKGKNKLRNTGDKDIHQRGNEGPSSPRDLSSAQAQTVDGRPAGAAKLKNERRSSWAIFSLGRRSSRSDLVEALRSAQQAPARRSLLSLLQGQGQGQGQGQQPDAESEAARAEPPHQAEHPNETRAASISSSLPPRLPSLRSVSPFNSGPRGGFNPSPYGQLSLASGSGRNGNLNTINPLTSSIARRESNLELVSPVSETLTELRETELGDTLHVPAPISKQQPSWDPFTGSPLVEEEDFDFDQDEDEDDEPTLRSIAAPVGAAISTGAHAELGIIAPATPARAALNAASARASTDQINSDRPVENANTGNRANNKNDSSVALSKQMSAAMSGASQNRMVSPEPAPQLQSRAPGAFGQAVPMAAYAQNLNMANLQAAGSHAQQAYGQQAAYPDQQQADSNVPHRQTSFVGLPPIRRASTFSSLIKSPDEAAAAEDSSGVTNQQQQVAQAALDASPTPPQFTTANQAMGGQNQFMYYSPPPPGELIPSVYRPTQGALPGQAQGQYPGHAHGQPQPLQGHFFHNVTVGNNGQQTGMQQPQGFLPGQNNSFGQFAGQVPPRGFAGPASGPPHMMNGGSPPPIGQVVGQVMGPGGRPVPMPPHMVQRFQPQGGWNYQESHLSAPLQSTNRHRSSASNASSQQPFYGYDKETGVPSTGGLSPQVQRAEQEAQTGRPSDQQASDAPGQQEQSPAPQTSQVSPINPQSPASQRAPGDGLSRVESNQSDLTAPAGGNAAGDEGRHRRNSGLLSGFRERFGNGQSEERRGSPGPRFQGVAGDAVSEASVVTEDTAGQRKRGSLFGLSSAGQGSENVAQSNESIVAQGPGTPIAERMQPSPSPQVPAPEKKRTFLGIGSSSSSSAPQQAKPARPDMPRGSTDPSMTVLETLPAGSIGGPPKKRLSALKDMFHRPQDGPNRPETAQSARPSMHGAEQGPAPPLAPGAQPRFLASPPSAGHEGRIGKPATQASPSGPLGQGSHKQLGDIADYDRGRKPTGGLFGFFKNRTDSKTRDGKPTGGQGPLFGPGQQHPGQQHPGQQHPGQQPLGQQPPWRGQMTAFPPAQGQYPLQYGTQAHLGPDGRPVMPPGQFVPHPGQPISQQPPFIQLGAQGRPPMQPQMAGPQPTMPMSPQQAQGGTQTVDMARGQQAAEQGAGQRPPMAQQQESGLATTQQQYEHQHSQQQQPPVASSVLHPPTVLQQSQGQLAPRQDPASANVVDSTVSSSPRVDSPLSLRSQPVTRSTPEPTRSQEASPVSVRQPVPVPQPGVTQAGASQTPQTQGSYLRAAHSTPAQLPARKPVQSSPKPPSGDHLRPQVPPTLEGQRLGQRSPSVSSSPVPVPPPGFQASPARTGTQFTQFDQLAGYPSPTGGQQAQGLNVSQNTQGHSLLHSQATRQPSSPAVSPISQTPQPVPVPVPTPTSQPSAQRAGVSQGPPAQQPNQPPVRFNGGEEEQGTPALPGQAFPAAQAPWGPSLGSASASQASQQFPPGNNQNYGIPVGAPIMQKEQSTISKLFKSGRPSGEAQEKGGKEKGAKKSFMGAFRRAPRQQQEALQQPPHPQSPQGHGQFMHGQPAQMVQQGPPPSQSTASQPLQPQMAPQMAPQMTGPQPQGQASPQPGPHMQYQHQRHSPPNASPGPNEGPMAQRPNPQLGQQQDVPPAEPPTRIQQPSQQQPLPLQQGGNGAARPGQQMNPPLAGQNGPMGQQQGHASGEPQYAQVPIPRGYAYVHSEGRVEPAPYYVGAGVPGGQSHGPKHAQTVPQTGPQTAPPGLQQQYWVQNNTMMPPDWTGPVPVPPPGTQQKPQLPPQGQLHPQVQRQSPPTGGGAILPQQRPEGAMGGQPGGEQGSPQQVLPAAGQQQPRHLPTSSPIVLSQAHDVASQPPSGLSITPHMTPGGPSPGQHAQPRVVSPPNSQFQSQAGSTPPAPAPTAPHTMGQRSNTASPPPRLQHPASPSTYPLPNSAFSPVNPAAASAPNPPPPQGMVPAPGAQGLMQRDAHLVPQRQVSAVSQMSFQPASVSPPQRSNVLSPGSRLGSSPTASPSPQVTPERAVSPEPAVQSSAPPNSVAHDSRAVSPEPPAQSFAPPRSFLDQQTHQRVEHDNIYDATPRTSVQSPPPQHVDGLGNNGMVAPAENAELKANGSSHGAVEPNAKEPEHVVVATSPPPEEPIPHPGHHVAVAQSSTANGTGAPPKPSSADIFEEAKRKMLLREQEEKIPVFPTEPDMTAAAAATTKKKDEEELPRMTATSYPGQEWNPYGDGGYEDWNE